jgi:hypothetical protein
MKRLMTCTFVLAIILATAHAQQKSGTGTSANQQKTAARFAEKLLKFLGISNNPSTLKGPEIASGELWVADLDTGSTHAVTEAGGYRSPIFLPGTKDILVLRGTDVIRIPLGSGPGKKVYSVDDITKLVGANSDDPGSVLILLRGKEASNPRVGLLSVKTGAVTILPYDSGSSQDLQMVESLEGWARAYGDQQVYVKRQTKQALSGTIEWSDVFRKVGGAEPVDVSHCDGRDCGQPSLSENGRLLIFVKAPAE